MCKVHFFFLKSILQNFYQRNYHSAVPCSRNTAFLFLPSLISSIICVLVSCWRWSWDFHVESTNNTNAEGLLSAVDNEIEKNTWYQNWVQWNWAIPCGGNIPSSITYIDASPQLSIEAPPQTHTGQLVEEPSASIAQAATQWLSQRAIEELVVTVKALSDPLSTQWRDGECDNAFSYTWLACWLCFYVVVKSVSPDPPTYTLCRHKVTHPTDVISSLILFHLGY